MSKPTLNPSKTKSTPTEEQWPTDSDLDVLYEFEALLKSKPWPGPEPTENTPGTGGEHETA